MENSIAIARKLSEKLAEFIAEEEKDLLTIMDNTKNYEDTLFAIRILLPYKIAQKVAKDKNFKKDEELAALLALGLTLYGE